MQGKASRLAEPIGTAASAHFLLRGAQVQRNDMDHILALRSDMTEADLLWSGHHSLPNPRSASGTPSI